MPFVRPSRGFRALCHRRKCKIAKAGSGEGRTALTAIQIAMNRDRIVAGVLLLIALLSLAASKAAPFLDDAPAAARTAIVILGVVCGLGGVWLWLRRSPEQQ